MNDEEEKKEKKIHVPMHSNQSMTIDGLKEDEAKKLRASMLGGHHWVRRDENGRLEHVPSYEPLPGPLEDDEMLPFWRKPIQGETAQAELFGFDTQTDLVTMHGSPSIYIIDLCGYNYSKENYRHEAKKLTA